MKTKILLLFLIVLCLTGCSAEYNIDIFNGKINEDLNIIEKDKNIINRKFNVELDNTDYDSSNDSYTYDQLAKNNLKILTPVYYNGTGENYKKNYKNNSNGLLLNYNYEFNMYNYKNSNIVNSMYKNFSATFNDESFIIALKDSSTCFQQYKMLEEITIHIKTNHKVIYSNADKVDNNNYYWYINKTNAKNKLVSIQLYSNEYIKDNINVYIIVGLLSVAFLIFIVIIIMKKKANKNNKI